MNKKIVIYSTPTCPYCGMAKDYFRSLKLEFIEIDVSKDNEKAKYIVEKTQQMGVPVIEIDGEFVTGFDKEEINRLLGKGNEASMG